MYKKKKKKSFSGLFSARLQNLSSPANIAFEARRGISVLRYPGLVGKFDDWMKKRKALSYEVLFLAFADYALRAGVSVKRGFGTVV